MRRYVILCEGGFAEHDAKTATGVLRYAPDPVVAVIDSTRAGSTVRDHVPGLDLTSRSSPRWTRRWRASRTRC